MLVARAMFIAHAMLAAHAMFVADGHRLDPLATRPYSRPAHEYTTVLEMTRLPDDYPDHGVWVSMIPSSANKAMYDGRG